MKKLSDYKGEDAIDLWADLLEPLSIIFTNNDIKSVYHSKESALIKAKTIIKNCKAETIEILERIDPTPIDGLNLVVRLVEMLVELEGDDTLKGFFDFSEPEKREKESSGSVTENTLVGAI